MSELKHRVRNATARIHGIMTQHCRHCSALLPLELIKASLREIEEAVKREGFLFKLRRRLMKRRDPDGINF